ncbi:hypothetical protein MnTg02_01184 [bacterium MnTg02]|nr:hypothetical protein MnTg02_01184 [bacterium MnTg02]
MNAVIRQPPRLIINNLFDGWHLIGNLKHLVDLLLIFGDDEFDPCMLKDKYQFLGDRILISGHRQGAKTLRCEESPIKPRAVVTNNGDCIATLQTKHLEAESERPNLIQNLRPAPCLPDA